MIEWLKATGIAILITLVGLGIFIGARQFLSGSEEAVAKALAHKMASLAAARDLVKKSQNSVPDPGLLAALQLLRNAGEALEKLNLGCIDKKGARHSDKCVFLSNIDLSPNKELELKPALFSGFELSGANFLAANLSWVNFKHADLRGANLSTTNLYRANFNRANLFKANFKGADFLYSDLLDANLSGTNMAGAKNLRQPALSRACLSNPRLPPLNLPAGLKPPMKKCR